MNLFTIVLFSKINDIYLSANNIIIIMVYKFYVVSLGREIQILQTANSRKEAFLSILEDLDYIVDKIELIDEYH